MSDNLVNVENIVPRASVRDLHKIAPSSVQLFIRIKYDNFDTSVLPGILWSLLNVDILIKFIATKLLSRNKQSHALQIISKKNQ